MLSGSTHENKRTRTSSLRLRNGQNAYNHGPDYTDPWSTNLANYLLEDLPASGIAEDKRESETAGKASLFFFFCERMWCGTWLWPDLTSLVSISSFLRPRNNSQGDGWLIVQSWITKIVWSW